MNKYLTMVVLAIIALIIGLSLILGSFFPHDKSSTNANSVEIQAKTNPVTNATIDHGASLTSNQEKNLPNALNIDHLMTLGDWKAAVTNLKQVAGLPNMWNMSESFTNVGIPLVIEGANGRHVTFFFNGLSVQTDERRGEIYRIDIQNSWMNLADVRSFGTKLLGVLGKDDPSFYAWCDKSAGGWNPDFLDSVYAPFPHSDKVYGFQVLNTYDHAKPWRVVLVITDPN